MNKQFIFLLFIYIPALSLQSCSENQIKNPGLPSVFGKAGEILIVIDKTTWKSALGDTIRTSLSTAIPMLPQNEPYFTFVQIQDDKFSDLFKKHRNILLVNIKPKNKRCTTVKDDVWASPQLVINITDPSVDSMMVLFLRERENIKTKFLNKERNLWISLFERTYNSEIYSALKKIHNFTLFVPPGYKLDVNKRDFIWISNENSDVILGIIAWEYPYISENQLKLKNLVQKRDEVVMKNVPGPHENSYMLTEPLIMPKTKEFNYKERYYIQMNGLWRMHNAFMGGPFISLTTVDKNNKRIITIEGFVHAPRKEKRNFVRQLEAILFTFQIPQKK